MKTRLIYAMIILLLAGNAALLLRKGPSPDSRQFPRQETVAEQEKVLTLDSLVVSRWADGARIRPAFTKPTFLLFFSKTNCATCVEQVVDYLTRHAGPLTDSYIIAADIRDPAEREAYDARFLRSLPFFSVESVGFPRGFEPRLPLLLVVDNKRQILFAKNVVPTDDIGGAYLFWKRIDFLHYLLAL